jgi:hypothetical protein
MFDIHPAQHAARGWREFLIHIATISIGLLLALGLERFAEYLHHRSQVATARTELEAELATNRERVDLNLAEAKRIAGALDANLKELRSNPAALNPDALSFEWHFRWPRDGAWQVVKQDGSLQFMPREEIQRYNYLYESVDYEMRYLDLTARQLGVAQAISQRAAVSPLTPRDLEELSTAISEAKASANYLVGLLSLTRPYLDERKLQ